VLVIAVPFLNGSLSLIITYLRGFKAIFLYVKKRGEFLLGLFSVPLLVRTIQAISCALFVCHIPEFPTLEIRTLSAPESLRQPFFPFSGWLLLSKPLNCEYPPRSALPRDIFVL